MLKTAVAHLRKSTPVEWVNWRCAQGLQAGAIFTVTLFVLQQISDSDFMAAGLPKKTELIIKTGMADAATSLLKSR